MADLASTPSPVDGGREQVTPAGTGDANMVATMLRAEGAVLFAVGLTIYLQLPWSWWWFPVLLLLPDVSMLGYLANLRLGALLYNLGHTIIGPLLLLSSAWWLDEHVLLAAGAIWLAHIGMDRALGYGLKYPTGFRHTHFDRV